MQNLSKALACIVLEQTQLPDMIAYACYRAQLAQEFGADFLGYRKMDTIAVAIKESPSPSNSGKAGVPGWLDSDVRSCQVGNSSAVALIATVPRLLCCAYGPMRLLCALTDTWHA